MITIRKATIADLQTILDFNTKLCTKEHKEFDPTINPNFPATERGISYFKRTIEDNDRSIFIAEVGEKSVGYIAGGLEPVGAFRLISNMCEVDNMWVDEEYRSHGVGTQLMDMMTTWAREKGTKRMRVVASFGNNRAIDFYKKKGFGELDVILERDV